MHEYFGMRNTQKHIRKISLERNDENNRIFTLKIESHKRELDPLHTYISGLPRDVNNYIYSFISTTIEMKHRIEIPMEYPFRKPQWTLLEFKIDGKSKKEEENKKEELICDADWTPAFVFDKEILTYISTLDWL